MVFANFSITTTLRNSNDIFERRERLARPNLVGAIIPPHRRLYSARAPIHPKRPYGSTRPVVPPDGSFAFGDSKRAAATFVVAKPPLTGQPERVLRWTF